jgi:hypothetical protein
MGALVVAPIIWRADMVPQNAAFHEPAKFEANLRGGSSSGRQGHDGNRGEPGLVIEGAIVGASCKPVEPAAASLLRTRCTRLRRYPASSSRDIAGGSE